MDLQEKFHLQRLAEGNRESFVHLHKKYQSQVYHFGLKFVQSPEVMEEITSDVFVKLWEKRDQLRTDIPVGPLLCKITKDLAFSHLREVSRHADRRQAFIEHYLARMDNPIEGDLFIKEGLKIASEAIDSLPPKCREVFLLRYMEGLSLLEIAAQLNISTNTVQNHLLKGTRIVRMYLQKHADLVFSAILLQFL